MLTSSSPSIASVQGSTSVVQVEGFMPPVMTREAFAKAIGLPVGVFIAQCEKGYWPQITVGRRVLVCVEAVRLLAAKKAEEFTL